MKTKRQAEQIVSLLEAEYPDARCSLDYGKDYEFLFAVRLSAQCTDARVNLVTPALFAAFPTLEAFADADREELDARINEYYDEFSANGLENVVVKEPGDK